MKILSLDPGKVNSFAYALIENGKCQKTGVLWSIEDLTPDMFQKNYTRFGTQIRSLIKSCNMDPKTDRIVLERYITRPGMGMGNNSEFLNIMIGILVMVALPFPVAAIPPSQWKNYMRKTYDIGKKIVKKDKKKEIKSKKAVVKKDCKYENILALLQEKYPKSTMNGNKKDWLKIHEADALGIGVYWWEELTGTNILNQVWDIMDQGLSTSVNYSVDTIKIV